MLRPICDTDPSTDISSVNRSFSMPSFRSLGLYIHRCHDAAGGAGVREGGCILHVGLRESAMHGRAQCQSVARSGGGDNQACSWASREKWRMAAGCMPWEGEPMARGARRAVAWLRFIERKARALMHALYGRCARSGSLLRRGKKKEV